MRHLWGLALAAIKLGHATAQDTSCPATVTITQYPPASTSTSPGQSTGPSNISPAAASDDGSAPVMTIIVPHTITSTPPAVSDDESAPLMTIVVPHTITSTPSRSTSTITITYVSIITASNGELIRVVDRRAESSSVKGRQNALFTAFVRQVDPACPPAITITITEDHSASPSISSLTAASSSLPTTQPGSLPGVFSPSSSASSSTGISAEPFVSGDFTTSDGVTAAIPTPWPWWTISSGKTLSLPSPTTSSKSSSVSFSGTTTGVPSNFWALPDADRTLTCKPPCSMKFPCYTADKEHTFTPDPWTTTVCRPNCGTTEFKTYVTTTFPAITTSVLCPIDQIFSEEGEQTPVPYWGFGSTTMDMTLSQGGWTTCTPHHMNAADDGTCGPDRHFLCKKGKCCSKDGKCGDKEDEEHCGKGCQPNWGKCWKNETFCAVPVVAAGGRSVIPIFPVLVDNEDNDNDHIIPKFKIVWGDIRWPDFPTIDWPPCKWIGGCDGEWDCGIFGCDGITGWFNKMWPKIKTGCHSLVKKVLCALLKIGCCPKSSSDNDTPDCDFCDPPGGDDITLNGEGNDDDDDDDCTSSSVVDQTVYCDLTTAKDYTSSTCTSTASATRSGCDLDPASTTTVTTTACKTTSAAHVTSFYDVLTASGTATTTFLSAKTEEVKGCTVTPFTTSKIQSACITTSAPQVTDFCSVYTSGSYSSTTCTARTKEITGCDVEPFTTSVYTTDCSTTVAPVVTEVCNFLTALNSTISSACRTSTVKEITGCDVSATTISSYSTSCQETTAPSVVSYCDVITATGTATTTCSRTYTFEHTGCDVASVATASYNTDCATTVVPSVISSFAVATGGNWTTTMFQTANTISLTGCNVQPTGTKVLTTSCYSSNTVTSASYGCYVVATGTPTTISGTAVTPSMTCTQTATTVFSGCDLTGTTTTQVNTSYPVCMATGQISYEPVTYGSNLTTSSTASSCGPPTSSGLGLCTKINVGQAIITEAFLDVTSGSMEAKRQASTTAAPVTASTDAHDGISCWCGSTASQLDIWPVTVCGNMTWCPNEDTSYYNPSETIAPATVNASTTATTCAAPTSSNLPACTPIIVGGMTVTEASGFGSINTSDLVSITNSSISSSTSAGSCPLSASINTDDDQGQDGSPSDLSTMTASTSTLLSSTSASTTSAMARRQDTSDMGLITAPSQTGPVTTGGVSCWCGSSVTEDVWPILCGTQFLCPNQPSSWMAATGTPAPATLTS